ncbi:hypothetical protein EV360DRAFT_85665 [Lentinula raphanica]|nr:hypothetical protein EV360DRAFT_85665 [Lentinula raphanica]
MAHSQFWDQHYSNVLPPLSPRSSQFRGEIHETLTDLPYTLLPASESPSPNLSPLELPPRQPTPRMRPLINVGDFNQPTPTTRLPPLSNISPERCQTPDIAVSPAGSPSKPITEPPPSPGKENEGIKEPSKTKKRQQWTGSDLIALARAVLEKEPYVQPHGKKGKVWSEIKDILVAEKSVTSDTNATAVQHKAESLVSYWKNPKSSDKGIKTIAKVFDKRPGYKITIAALMDGVESQWDRGKSESEVVKEKNQKKKDEDTEGGEAIRRASLQTMGLRNTQVDQTEDKTDTESDNNSESLSHKRKFDSVSVASLNEDDNDDDKEHETTMTAHKRRRRSARRSTSNSDLLDFLRADSADRKAHQERLEQQGSEMTRILHGFLELDRARFEREKEN